MNLDPQDLELIKATVKAAVADADLVKNEDFKGFRAEVLSAQQQFVQREVFELRMNSVKEELDKLWDANTASKNAIATIWETAWGKVALIAGGLLQVWMVWQILHP